MANVKLRTGLPARCGLPVTRNEPQDETLQRSLLAAILESADDAIVHKTLQGQILSWSAGAERIFGYRAEEAIGRPITLIIPPELHAQEQLILAKVQRGERIDHLETIRVGKDGRRMEVSLSVSPVRDSAGSIVGALKVLRPIEAERGAARLRAQLAAIVECSDDAIVSKTLDGIIQSWNGGASRIFGYSAEEAVGKPILLIVPPELHAQEQQILRRLGNGERIEHFDTIRLTKDGRRIPISLSVSPLRDARGVIIGAAKIARDISERKRAELALRATEERLRQADRRKDEFLALLAHELRNPLAPIRYALATVKKLGHSCEQQQRAEEVIERQVAHMSRLLDDLLDASRITRGTLGLKKGRTELTTVLGTAIEAARPILIDNLREEIADCHPEMLRRFAIAAHAYPAEADAMAVRDDLTKVRTFLGRLQGVQNVLTMGFFESYIQRFMSYLADLAVAQGSADLEYTEVHGVCDIAHSEGLLKAFSAEAEINPPDPAADLFEGVNKLRALIQTINGKRACDRTCGLSGSVTLRQGSCNRFAVSGAIPPVAAKLLAVGVGCPGTSDAICPRREHVNGRY